MTLKVLDAGEKPQAVLWQVLWRRFSIALPLKKRGSGNRVPAAEWAVSPGVRELL